MGWSEFFNILLCISITADLLIFLQTTVSRVSSLVQADRKNSCSTSNNLSVQLNRKKIYVLRWMRYNSKTTCQTKRRKLRLDPDPTYFESTVQAVRGGVMVWRNAFLAHFGPVNTNQSSVKCHKLFECCC